MNQIINYELYILKYPDEHSDELYKYILISYYDNNGCYFISTDYIRSKILEIEEGQRGSLLLIEGVALFNDDIYRNKYDKIGTFNTDELRDYFAEEFI